MNGKPSEPTSGNWRQGKFPDTVVSDCNCGDGACGSPVSRRAYFGGHLVAMRIENEADVPLIAAAKETAAERAELLAEGITLLAAIDAGGMIDLEPMRAAITKAKEPS